MFTPVIATEPDPLPTTPAGWADAIAARVNTFGIGLWLLDVGVWLGYEGRSWLPQCPAETPQNIDGRPRGLALRLRPLPTFIALPQPFRLNHIVLEAAVFGGQSAREHPAMCALPFGLDPAKETPDSAAHRFGVSPCASDGDNPDTVRYVLDDGREVEVIFQPSFHSGIKGVWVRRPGPPSEAA